MSDTRRSIVERFAARLPVVGPLFIAVIAGAWVFSAVHAMTFAAFGRDPGIFQYVGWAISQGERPYVDFREINGPLSHVIHWFFQRLGGEDEHVFRTLDVIMGSLAFAGFGFALPGLASKNSTTAPTLSRRLAAAAAACTLLFAQYVQYEFWHTAQRESFYVYFLLGSIALNLHALTGAHRGSPRLRVWLLAAAGFLSALTWFGKPTCALYSVFQVAVICLDRDAPVSRRKAVAYFALGSAIAAAVMLGFVAWRGDIGAAARNVLIDAPRLYRYVWKLSVSDCYVVWGNRARLNLAFITLAGLVAFALLVRPPRRFYLVPLLLVFGLATFFVQSKGFPYHLHPVTAGTYASWLAMAIYGAEYLAASQARKRWALVFVLAFPALAFKAAWDAKTSDYVLLPAASRSAAFRETEEYFVPFKWADFFAYDLREAANFVRSSTYPNERVQTYGMDPYVLFLAKRRSATPFIYSFELNVDAALAGGSGGAPDASERAWILDFAREKREQLLAALEKEPPAAFVLVDLAPFTNPPNADFDFAGHCPLAYSWMIERFEPTARFGNVRVWLRKDVAARASRSFVP